MNARELMIGDLVRIIEPDRYISKKKDSKNIVLKYDCNYKNNQL